MSMSEIEDFVEVGVRTIAQSNLDIQQKRSAIAVLYDLESNGDCSFTNLRNIDDLVASKYTTAFPKKNLPASLKNTSEQKLVARGDPYWNWGAEKNTLHVDSGTKPWKRLVAEGLITGEAARDVMPMSYEQALLLLHHLKWPADARLLMGALGAVILGDGLKDFDDKNFHTIFGLARRDGLDMVE